VIRHTLAVVQRSAQASAALVAQCTVKYMHGTVSALGTKQP